MTDLTDNATILYSSDSVVDILGYTPDEIVNRSAWEFFPQEELLAAQKFHQRRVASDKAAVLAYVRVRDSQGQWVGCECCLTIVYDVMVVCTSVYRRGIKSESECSESFLLSSLRADIAQSVPWRHQWYGACSPHRPRIQDTTCCLTFPPNSLDRPRNSHTNLARLFS